MSKFPLVEEPTVVSDLVPDLPEILALKSMPEYYLDSLLSDCRISEDYKVKKANEKLINLLFIENEKLKLQNLSLKAKISFTKIILSL